MFNTTKSTVPGVHVKKAKRHFLVTSENQLVGVLEVDPINLEMLSESRQNAIHEIYRELLDELTYSIEVHSIQRRRSLKEYGQWLIDQNSGDRRHKKSYLNHCRILDKRGIITTTHYIVVRVNARRTSCVRLLISRLKRIKQTLSTDEFAVRGVTGRELERLGRRFSRRKVLAYKDHIRLPVRTGSIYRKTVYVHEFPANIGLGWVAEILRVNDLVDITQVIKPVDTTKATKQLDYLRKRSQTELNIGHPEDYRGVNKLESVSDDVERFLDLLADRECTAVHYGVYITVRGRSRKRLEKTFEQVLTLLRSLRIDYRVPVYRSDLAYSADSPLAVDRLDEKMLMPSISAASSIPFVNQDFGNQRGVIYGIETEDGTPVFLDRFSWRSYAMVVMGITGSGKTYATKLELLRMLLAVPDLRVIIVDPKQEYGSTIEAIGGKTYAITEDREYDFDDRIQCFQVLERGKLENIPLITDLVEQIYSDVSKYPGKTLVIIDEAKLLMNDEDGRKVLEQFVLEARDTNTAVSILVQSAAHLTDWREGRIILDNAYAKLFMRHDRVSQSTIDFFRLSERKQQRLLSLRTGRSSKHSEGILEVSDQINARVRFEATPLEHRLIEPSLRARKKKESKQRIRREAR